MRDRKFFGKINSMQITIALCCLVVCVITIILIMRSQTETITELEAPLGAASIVMQSDEMTVRISAPEVDDLYGYQFRLEYDSTRFTASNLKSLIDEIPTIFKKDFDGYILIGATMTGDSPGYSAVDTQICELTLTALTDDGKLPEINLSKVSVVSSGLAYTEDVYGWGYEVVTDNHGG